MAEMSNKKNVLSSANKTKKSKNDLIRAAVGHYLKQKSYVGSEKIRKSDFMLLQNKKQFVFNKMIESDVRNGGNSFVYSNVLCINNNQHIVDQQLGKFQQFVESQKDSFIRMELRRFFGPMLCHLYLELIKARESKSAVDFLRKYAHLVAPVENYEAPLPTKINGCSVPAEAAVVGNQDDGSVTISTQIKFSKISTADEDPEQEFFIKLVQMLSTCTKHETAENIEEVRLFRCSKYELYITEEVFETLNAYLQKKGHVLMVNLLYTWIHINIIDHEVRQWTEDYLFHGPDEDEDDDLEQHVAVPASASTVAGAAAKGTAEEETEALNDGAAAETELSEKKGRELNVLMCLKTIRESGEKLLATQTEFPRFVNLGDKCRGLTSAHFDLNECHLVGGYDNAVVQLWQMNQHTCRGANMYQSCVDSSCQWELNNYCGEEEDEIDSDIQFREAETACDQQNLKYSNNKYAENSFNDYGGIQLRGHSRGVTDVCFSSYYPLLYSVSKDATMRSWRAENYSCAAVYRGHSYPIWCVAESPVGMYNATGSKDLTARLWSLEREFPLITYVGHTQDVECLAFHPNGNYIATGSADLSVRLWCVTSGKLMRVFSDCKQPVTTIAFSPDGKMLAVGGEETKIRIFDLAAGAQLSELKEHTSSVTDIAWSGSGRLLASACHDGSMRVWDVTKLNPIHNSTSSSSSLTTGNRLLALSSNCQRLVKVFFSRNEVLSCIGS